jgi:hypothetical protein
MTIGVAMKSVMVGSGAGLIADVADPDVEKVPAEFVPRHMKLTDPLGPGVKVMQDVPIPPVTVAPVTVHS